MLFLPLHPEAATTANFFGIAEPRGGADRALAPLEFDTIVVPLLGFDRRGVRLGMGAGYYDRALRRRIDSSRAWRRPRLIGVAYACQELPVDRGCTLGRAARLGGHGERNRALPPLPSPDMTSAT